jgi:Putative peptidoglycan binding domain/LysM domain
MSTAHRVEQGDTLYTIAKQFGFPNWKVIFDDPSNADLKAKRKNPQILHPGDVVQIPDVSPDKGLKVPLDRRTIITLTKIGFQPLRLVLLDGSRFPLEKVSYVLSFEGGEIKGQTDEQGLVSEQIPVGIVEVTLRIGEEDFSLRVGHLNPLNIDTSDQGISGSKGRLKNLGYFIELVDGEFGPDAKEAVLLFQAEHRLTKTGTLDAPTRETLLATHLS